MMFGEVRPCISSLDDSNSNQKSAAAQPRASHVSGEELKKQQIQIHNALKLHIAEFTVKTYEDLYTRLAGLSSKQTSLGIPPQPFHELELAKETTRDKLSILKQILLSTQKSLEGRKWVGIVSFDRVNSVSPPREPSRDFSEISSRTTEFLKAYEDFFDGLRKEGFLSEALVDPLDWDSAFSQPVVSIQMETFSPFCQAIEMQIQVMFLAQSKQIVPQKSRDQSTENLASNKNVKSKKKQRGKKECSLL